MSLSEARIAAQNFQADAERGIDPIEKQKEAKALNISKNDDTKLQLVAIKMIENSKDTADGTSRSVEKKPTSNAKLTKPFIQVGIFGVENNAVKTGNQMSKLGLQTNTFEFNEFC